jgi:hypothetical protein
MKLKYSLSHLMLLFVIVGLICLWNIERQKIDALTEQLNQSKATLNASLSNTSQHCKWVKDDLQILKDDPHYRDVSIEGKIAVVSIEGVIEELNSQTTNTQQALLQAAQ